MSYNKINGDPEVVDISLRTESIATQDSLVRTLNRSGLVSLLSILVAVCSLIIATMVVYNTHDRYFTVSPKGVITQLVSLDEAMVTDEMARKFSRDFVVSLYSINYINFRKKIEDVESMFYPLSFDNFIVEFEDILNFIKKKKVYAHALVELPVLVRKVEHNGRMKWKFEMPVSIYYESATGFKRQQKVIATIIIQRTDNRKKIGGIEVFSFITQAKSNK